jgi:hypothetical protein
VCWSGDLPVFTLFVADHHEIATRRRATTRSDDRTGIAFLDLTCGAATVRGGQIPVVAFLSLVEESVSAFVVLIGRGIGAGVGTLPSIVLAASIGGDRSVVVVRAAIGALIVGIFLARFRGRTRRD